MATMTAVSACAATSCAYNNDGCSAEAVTITADSGASCGTFIELDVRGGLPVAQGHVGACQRLEWVHNSDLMCTAEAITVGGDTASCQTYAAS